MSLRLRLALFGAAVVAVTLVLFGALLYALFARGVNNNQDDALRSRAHDAMVALASARAEDLTARAPLAPADLKTSTEVFLEVLAPDGSLVYSTAQLNGLPPGVPPALLAKSATTHGSFATAAGLRLYAQPFTSGYVVTGQSTRVPQSNLSGIVGFLIISGVPTLIAALAASWLVAGRALKPLKDVAGAAEESERMGRLVDRMLTLARADSGLRLDLAPVDLRSVVVDVTRQAAAVHPERAFEVDVVDASVAGDQDALRQLLWILLDNALRHSRSTISVGLSVESGWARLVVGDDGPGIAVGERERVFVRFYRSDVARTGQGAGLGLAIARWITDQHGGRIIAHQSKAGGAGLYVDLPLLRPS